MYFLLYSAYRFVFTFHLWKYNFGVLNLARASDLYTQNVSDIFLPRFNGWTRKFLFSLMFLFFFLSVLFMFHSSCFYKVACAHICFLFLPLRRSVNKIMFIVRFLWPFCINVHEAMDITAPAKRSRWNTLMSVRPSVRLLFG